MGSSRLPRVAAHLQISYISINKIYDNRFEFADRLYYSIFTIYTVININKTKSMYLNPIRK